MENTIYKLGVVGLGEGRSIMSAALNSPNWELKKVCDLNTDICKEREEEFGFSNWTTNYDELLRDTEIDVIAIYTPDQLHVKHIKMALKSGKHVICTKPLLVSLEHAKELIELSTEVGKHVFVGQSTRFYEPMIHQREDFEAGKHGDLQTIDSHYITDGRWFIERAWSKEAGFSWMYNFMIHPVDMICWYMPHITEVTGFGRTSKTSKDQGIQAWDHMRFILKDKEGRIGTIFGNYTAPTLDRNVEGSIECTIRGTEGVSRSEYLNLHYHTHFLEEGKKKKTFDHLHKYYFRFEGESHHAGEYQNYLEYFSKCLDEGKTPLPDVKEGVKTIAIMEALQRSAEKDGIPVKIEEVLKEYHLDVYDKTGDRIN